MEIKLGTLGDYRADQHWEETGRDTISHIFVTFNNVLLTSIQFGYVENGALVLSKKYGSQNVQGHSTRIVRLKHESEFVTGISGETWRSSISSLTFHTNERKHEAFRRDLDSERVRLSKRTEFHSGIHDRRELGGFFGSCDCHELNSIGLYVRPVISGVHTIKQENV